jgi:hypothetical protein
MSALPPTTIGATRVYGMWIAIASAVSLVVLEAVRAWPERVPALPRGLVAVRVGATALLIVALFLPWQEVHLPVTAGHWASGWYPSVGAAAGSLCLLLVATPALPKLANYALEAIVAIVLMVSVLATEFRSDSFAFRIGWGAFLGIAAAATLLVTVLLRVRPGRVNGSRALARPFRSHSPFSALPQLSSRPGSSFQRAGDTRRPP